MHCFDERTKRNDAHAWSMRQATEHASTDDAPFTAAVSTSTKSTRDCWKMCEFEALMSKHCGLGMVFSLEEVADVAVADVSDACVADEDDVAVLVRLDNVPVDVVAVVV